jgi:hypothetical protein
MALACVILSTAMQLDVNKGVTSAGTNSNFPTAQFVARSGRKVGNFDNRK